MNVNKTFTLYYAVMFYVRSILQINCFTNGLELLKYLWAIFFILMCVKPGIIIAVRQCVKDSKGGMETSEIFFFKMSVFNI